MSINSKFVKVALCAAVVSFGAIPAFAATIVLEATDDPAANGIALTNAVVQAASGDEIVLGAGTYAVPSKIEKTEIVVRGATGNAADVLLKMNCGPWAPFIKLTASELSGVTLDGNGNRNYGSIVGGAVQLNGGTVSNCVIRGFRLHDSGKLGVGIALTGNAPGLVTHCIVTNNILNSGKGSIYIHSSVGTVRNCLVVGNTGGGSGAGVYIASGTLENCTIVANVAQQYSGVYADGGVIRNCLIGANTATGETNTQACNPNGQATFEYCVVPTAAADVGETHVIGDDDPFLNAAVGDWRPKAFSHIVDAGSDQEWMTGATDLSGSMARIYNGTVDIGAYESTEEPKVKALALFSATTTTKGFAPLEVSFHAKTENLGDPANIEYVWNFGDGTTETVTGGDATVTHIFNDPRMATVTLTARSALASAVAAPVVVTVLSGDKRVYVSSSGSNTEPYATWETAATDLGDALDFSISGCEVLVSNGVYAVNSKVLEGLSVRGITGNPADVTVKMNGSPWSPFIKLADSKLSGVTLDGNGKKILGNQTNGGAVWLNGGTVSNCVVRGFMFNVDSPSGVGITLKGDAPGLVTHCIVTNNILSGGNGSICIDSSVGTVRNCLVAGNTGGGSGAGVYVASGTLENCTIVANVAQQYSGVYATGGVIRNCLIGANTATGETNTQACNSNDQATFEYCVVPMSDKDVGTENVMGDDDPFVDAAAGKYEPARTSKAINAGMTQAWMTGATDLAGNPRLYQCTRVDIGCYETTVSQGFNVIMR